jgi:hypothetical protein
MNDASDGSSPTPADPPPQSRVARAVAGVRQHPVVLVLGLVLGAVVFLGQVSDAIPKVTGAFSGIGRVFADGATQGSIAYATPEEILLRSGAGNPQVLRTLERETVLQLHWSHDGRYLAALLARQEPGQQYPDLSDRRVWYHDTASREDGTWPCPDCDGLSFSGDLLLSLAARQPLVVQVFSLDDLPEEHALHGDAWGPAQQSETIATVLGGGPDGLLFAVADPAGISAQGGPELIYRVDARGEVAHLGQSDSNVGIQLAATRPNGRQVAVRYTEHSSACDNVDRVAVINLANSARTELPLPTGREAWRTSSIAWSADGDLYSTRLALSRDIDDCGELLVAPHVSRWDGTDWQRVEGTAGCVQVFAGDSRQLAALCSDALDDAPWRLVLREDEEQDWTDVAVDVVTAAWRPPPNSGS